MEHEPAVAPVVASALPRVKDPRCPTCDTPVARMQKALRPGITVCIAAHPARFRGPALLNRALASVVAQTLSPAAIHVVNDVDRQGAGWTRRTLLESVDTEWLAWLDSDDEWMPEHLEKLHRVAVDTDSVYVFSWMHGADPLGAGPEDDPPGRTYLALPCTWSEHLWAAWTG